MVYIWIYPIWILLCIRARSFFFFAAANPLIKNGGFLNESKEDIYALMPNELYPPTLYFKHGESPESVWHSLQQAGFGFPLIGKPNSGGRGRGVKIVHSKEDVCRYVEITTVDFHFQPYINLPKEAGIFYYRFPGQQAGKLSGIVRKEFLTVEGNGTQSIRDLMKTSERAILQAPSLERTMGPALDEILAAGETRVLSPYGNHARGAEFLDDSHLIDEQLTKVVDGMCKQVREFYYGRLDIRYNTWEELRQGKNFCIIEVNGSGSEPTHMYDPRHSLFFAWKEIVRHWIILWKISRMNHKKGSPYLSVTEGIAMFREDKIHSARLAAMTE